MTFYAVGQTLDGVGQDVLPRFARGFGFGQPTVLDELLEDGGLVPDPEWKADAIGELWWVGDTVNLSIGQGYLLVTPLQVARMIAAVGNGGTLYAPYIVERIGPSASGGGEQIVEPRGVGSLPISPEHLTAIQEALLGVTSRIDRDCAAPLHRPDHSGRREDRHGEAGGPELIPHSWFAAYAPANAPEIAIAVIVEHGERALRWPRR